MRQPPVPHSAHRDAGLVGDDGAVQASANFPHFRDDGHRGTVAATATPDAHHRTTQQTQHLTPRQSVVRSHRHDQSARGGAPTRAPKYLVFVPLMAAVVVLGLVGIVRTMSVEWTCGPVTAQCLDTATSTHATLRIPEAHATALDGCALYSSASKTSIFAVCVDVLAAANAKAGLAAVSPATVGLRFPGTFGLEQCLDVDGTALAPSDVPLWLPQYRCTL
jgi:hypothetical protein